MRYDKLVLGAAFDPPHLGHQKIARTVREIGWTSEVWLMPCKEHAFHKQMSLDRDRLVMARFLEEEGIRVSEMELERDGVSYAYDTLSEMQALLPGEKIGWLMGSDQLADFPKWYKYEEILVRFGAVIYPRKGYPARPLLPGMRLVTNAEEVEISSTEIRELIARGGAWENQVLPAVSEYIKEQHLYAT